MSERARRQGKGSWIENLVADPWRKLAAIGLAILLWVYLDSQVTDTRELEFRLSAIDPSENWLAADTAAGVSLHLVLPRESFTLLEFRDVVEDAPIRNAKLTFRGPRHLINRLDENPGFTVAPDAADLKKIEDFFEFDEGMIRARNPEFQPYLAGMTPRVVRARVARNSMEQVTMAPELLDAKLPAAEADPDFAERWSRNAVTFLPPLVTLSGPERALREAIDSRRPLFDVDLSAVARTNETEVRVNAELKPRYRQAGILMQPGVAISTYTLKPSFKSYAIEAAPVLVDLLSLDEQQRARLVAEPEHVTVSLRAGTRLRAELELWLGQGRTLRQWAGNKLHVLAHVPADAKLDETLVMRLEVLMLDSTLRRGIDWEASVDQPVTIRRRE